MPSLRLAISRLLTRENLTIPFVSGLPFELWLERQSKHILHLCQRSRKNCSAQYRFQSYRQKSWTMDWADTVPMEAGINGITGNSRWSSCQVVVISSSFYVLKAVCVLCFFIHGEIRRSMTRASKSSMTPGATFREVSRSKFNFKKKKHPSRSRHVFGLHVENSFGTVCAATVLSEAVGGWPWFQVAWTWAWWFWDSIAFSHKDANLWILAAHIYLTDWSLGCSLYNSGQCLWPNPGLVFGPNAEEWILKYNSWESISAMICQNFKSFDLRRLILLWHQCRIRNLGNTYHWMVLSWLWCCGIIKHIVYNQGQTGTWPSSWLGYCRTWGILDKTNNRSFLLKNMFATISVVLLH